MQPSSHLTIPHIFTFKKIKNWTNKLINKRLPTLHIDQLGETIEYRGEDNEPTITRAENSLNTEHCIAYYQAQVLKTTQDDTINIGIMGKDNNTKQFIGKMNHSFGYLKGELHINKKKVLGMAVMEKLVEGDRIGIGINCHKRQLFMVRNGGLVQNNIALPIGWNQFYPAVGLSNEGEKVKLYFNITDFRFKIQQYADKIQQQIELEIKKNEVPNHQVYSLVHQYLAFNGYNKTLELFNQKNIQFHKLGKLTKNPAVSHPKLTMAKKEDNDEHNVGQDQQMNQPLKLRNRIMSEKLPQNEEEIVETKRKNTEMVIEEPNQDLCPQRKLSIISNMSNVPNYNSQFKDFYCLQKMEEMPQILTQNQKFILNERKQIIKLIADKKIEEAMQIMQQLIPGIFQQIYLSTFMKAHIFLRKIVSQSITSAFQYSRSQKECFQNHLGSLFPYYSSTLNDVKWEPLRNIFLAMAYRPNTQIKPEIADIVSDKQFQFFGRFVNSLILKQMGYLGCSRLTFFISNVKKMQQKLKDCKGMTCGIQLNI